MPTTVCIALLSLASPTTAAPRSLEWIDHFGGSSPDWARGVSVTSNAVYAVGEGNPDGAVGNTFVRRYGAGGRVDWTVGIESRAGYPGSLRLIDVAAVEDGAYVLGSMRSARGSDVLVAKVASDGDVEWTARFGTRGSDSASSLSVTTSAIFVTGSTRGVFAGQTLHGEADAFVVRLDADGNVVWSRQFGTAGADAANAVWAGDGAVYVAGPTSGELSADGHVGGIDVYVRKFDPDGGEVWTRQLGSADMDSAFALDVEGQDIAVAGTTEGAMPGTSALGATDAFVTLLSRDGDRVWTHQFGGPDADTATAVAVDGDDISIGGSMAGGASQGTSDAVVWGFATSGTQTEVLRFGTGARDLISDLDVDPSGRYVVGVAPAAFSGESWNEEDAFVGRLRSRSRTTRSTAEAPLALADLNPRSIGGGSLAGGLFDANPVPPPTVTGPEPTATNTPAPTPTETATPSPSPDDNGHGNGNGNGNGGGGGGGGGGDPTGPTGVSGPTGATGGGDEVLMLDLLSGFVDILV